MNRAKDALKVLVGRAAEFALPGLAQEIDDNRNPDRAAAVKRAIVRARLFDAQSKGDAASIEGALAAFWKGQSGDRFHDHHQDARFQLFRDHHAIIVDALAKVIAEGGFMRLVEIGCGDGGVLAYCAERLPQIREAVGLDINEAVVARAAANHRQAGRPLSFVHSDAETWLAAHPQPGTVLFSNGGVLEYFSQASFDNLLQTLGRAAPAAIALVEPVAPDHDLASQTESFAHGWENSFSHNHRRRLSQAGFTVAYEQELVTPSVRWMLMIGVKAA